MMPAVNNELARKVVIGVLELLLAQLWVLLAIEAFKRGWLLESQRQEKKLDLKAKMCAVTQNHQQGQELHAVLTPSTLSSKT